MRPFIKDPYERSIPLSQSVYLLTKLLFDYEIQPIAQARKVLREDAERKVTNLKTRQSKHLYLIMR